MNGSTAAEALEELLGDADDPGNPHGFAAAAARDNLDRAPDASAAALRATGFHLNYLPPELGGSFTGFADNLTLVRAAARRDLAVMPATMFSVTAATCLRLHGSPQQQWWAAGLLAADGAIGFALSEEEHGSDLLANTTRLEPSPDGDGWLLTGRKWMVGLGGSCDSAYVVARTGERGPGAFTAVLADLTDPATADRFRRGRRVPATGMRGIDFAHLEFDRFPVPPHAVVGRPGEALEAAVKAQQIVRVMSCAGSLGCADTALRVTLDFAAARRQGRGPLLAAGYPRRELALAAAALLAADATALAAARGLHRAPEVFSVWGCAAKHVVAEAVSDLMARCAGVLSTRAVLRDEGPGGGIFQKTARDAALVRVVDTSTVANLRSFTGQLPALAAAADAAAAPDAATPAVFDLAAPLPPFDITGLDLNARGRDPVTAEAAPLAARLAEGTEPGLAQDAVTTAVVAELAAALRDLPREVAAAGRDAEALTDLAERFAWLHSAGCCLLLWWHNRDVPLYEGKPGATGWLGAVLAYLLSRADGTDPRRRPGALSPALDTALALRGGHRLFSLVPVRLAPPRPSARPHQGEPCPPQT
ncbi:acyl-CoA dehydrogenase family protein [Streptomyces bohaiensis]|uniref:Acyl-CoA dehydrogenase n=1 Tax=Streptomyces bohaiensis TaxID=1431344 RepID=A0ABX1CAK6_9ACTN|nr:acyl-CoA dehydrogenase [Streptomyces bohaiensis]NJQ14287.1 acyl-CoA dehydrogenase [Streptomyces bohaiensis]